MNHALKIGGLLAALAIGGVALDNLVQNNLARKYETLRQTAHEIGFQNYGVSSGPMFVQGDHDCGVCILVSPTETWTSHFGFKFSMPEKADRDTSYVNDMISSAKERPAEAYLIGGDERYLDRLKRALISASMRPKVLYCDNVRADGLYNQKNEKDIIISPEERRIIIKKEGRYKEIKY